MPVLASETGETTYYDGTDPNNATSPYRWWDLSDVDPETTNGKIAIAQAVFATAQQIFENLRNQRIAHYYFSMLYHDQNYGTAHTPNLGADNYEAEFSFLNTNITINSAQSAVDTAASMIAKNKPKPMCLTSGAKSNELKITAENCTKFLQGLFDENNVYEKAQEMFTDGAKIGTGCLHQYIDEDEKKVKIEYVFSEEILVDTIDGRNKTPRQLHWKHYYDRDYLLAKYGKTPELRQAIMTDNSHYINSGIRHSVSDVVAVVHAWHLPTTANAQDGYYAVCINNMTLLYKPYKKHYYPFNFFRWYPHTPNFYGRGLIQEIANLHLQVNKNLDAIDEGLELLGNATWLVEKTADVNSDEIVSNEIGKLVYYMNTPPQLVTPQVISAERFQHTWALNEKIFEISGVAQQNATGTKDDNGVTSAVGQQEVADLASGRFEVIAQRYENTFIDLAKNCIDLARDLYEKYPDLSVSFQEKRGITDIKFADADLKNNPYQIEVFPISGLPYSPAGRLDALTALADKGLINKEQLLSLSNFPDLEDTVSLETATTTFVSNAMSQMKQGADYIDPIQELDLALAFNLSSSEVVRAFNEKVPQDYIDNIRQFKNKCKDLIDLLAQQQTAAAPMQLPTAQAQPGMVPQPPPQSPPQP